MKIISPSATIVEHALPTNPVKRLETCGRICYQVDHERDAPKFVRKLIASGHGSALEMADVSVVVNEAHVNPTRYIEVTKLSGPKSLITGSIRAFREWFEAGIDHVTAGAAHTLLRGLYPDLFNEPIYPSRVKAEIVSPKWLYATGNIQKKDYERHRRVAVEFVVNRAVSHEIVRHRPCSFLQESQRYCAYREDVEFIKPLFFTEEYPIWEDAMRSAERVYKLLLQTSSPQAARTVLPNSTATRILVYASLAEWRHIFAQRDSAAADPSMREVMAPLHKEFKEVYF